MPRPSPEELREMRERCEKALRQPTVIGDALAFALYMGREAPRLLDLVEEQAKEIETFMAKVNKLEYDLDQEKDAHAVTLGKLDAVRDAHAPGSWKGWLA